MLEACTFRSWENHLNTKMTKNSNLLTVEFTNFNFESI